jgi:membrane dipeptidase
VATSPFVCTLSGPIVTDIRYRRQYLHERQVLLRHHLDRFREGLVDAIVIPVASVDDTVALLQDLSESEGRLRLVRTPDEVLAAKAEERVAVLLGVSFEAIGNSVAPLHLYLELGACLFALALNPRNLLTDGCGERTQAGLSQLGITVVQALAKHGMLIDVSHTSDAGVADVAEAVRGPFIASHSNSRTLCPNPRNLTDDQARAIARRGGLVGVSTYPTLIAAGSDASIEGFLDHIDYFVRLIGVEHVAIGADFIDFVRAFIIPKIKSTDPSGAIYGEHETGTIGLDGIQDFRKVVDGLAHRGYSDKDRQRILGGNFLRVWSQVRVDAGLS